MLKRLSVGRRQNGQGIVEYALLLAFILAIAIAMQGSGIDEAISNTFTRVAQALGVETEQDRWASMSVEDLKNVPNSERLAVDVKYLKSIKDKLIGNGNRSKAEVESILGTAASGSVLLGTFSYDENGYNFSLTRGGNASNTTLQDLSIFGFSSVEDGSTHRYFYSDYALDNVSNPTTNSLGVKAEKFKFENGKLTDVEIVINPNYKTNGNSGTTGRQAGLTTGLN
ncbi:Flp family type IVb pilin [Anaerovibrio lipolyticus]|uniref:Flp family type IVb pilin n=1 Tax=Anaerovibrio lipolyticus TaxID=82374 RepID=UPI000483CB4C|nr:hypothetical protein [Anaerovibrio lipolyticus]